MLLKKKSMVISLVLTLILAAAAYYYFAIYNSVRDISSPPPTKGFQLRKHYSPVLIWL